jgi:hypothetical protein
LSLIVFGGAVAEFLLLPRFGTSIFGLLAMLALVDFLSGIALRARRGTQPVAASTVSRRSARTPEVTAQPQFDPAPVPVPVPAPSAPAVAVAEPVPPDNPQPKVLQPLSPEVPSPELQPGNSSSSPEPPQR